MVKRLYLRKSNDELVSHCRCPKANALISSPCQMDCPWCGCGWLFICDGCRKAFTFAEVVEISESWEELADRNIRNLYRRGPEAGEVEDWIEAMEILLRGIQPGSQYVYLDGWVIPVNAEGVHIDGWHSRHDLEFVPQVAAMADARIRSELLGLPEYWMSSAVDLESR